MSDRVQCGHIKFGNLGGAGGVNYTDDLPLKLPSTIYPKSSDHLYDLPPQNHQGRFTPQIAKYDLPQIICTIYPLPPKITREDLPPQIAKYNLPPPKNCKGRFTPSNHQVQLTPPPTRSSNFEQNFRHTTPCFASQRSFLLKTNQDWMREKGTLVSLLFPLKQNPHHIFTPLCKVLRSFQLFITMFLHAIVLSTCSMLVI